MNPGPTEEVGKVALGIVEAMRSNPALLMIIILNAIIASFVYFGTRERRAMDNEVMQVLLKQQAQAQDLLSRCVIPQIPPTP